MNGFEQLGLSGATLAALADKGFTEPTPIQARTIPLLLNGETDIVGQAMTGTGKTAAFGLPIIERAVQGAGHVQALILTPTRELAIQVAEEIASLRGGKRVNVLPVYGGQSIHLQLGGLRRGADIVVGTPGRVLDHLQRGTLRLDRISFFVLDEADEMCNMGFVDDVRAIFEQAGPERRTLLFSATMPHEVLRIATEFMGEYEVVSVRPERDETPLTRQIFHEVPARDRFEALCRVIDAEPEFYGLVFCRTRMETDRIAEWLVERGHPAEPIHGDLSQARREEILAKFRKRRVNILVATDVAARGIDVPDLTHVVNFALPQNPEVYVHRVGRTGRAGKNGVALTLISPQEYRKLMHMASSLRLEIKKQPLPCVTDVIRAKKARILSEMDAVLATKPQVAYQEMALELLNTQDPELLLAAVLQRAFGAELDPRGYREVGNPRSTHDVGTARRGGSSSDRVVFKAAVGRQHGMTARKFVDYICQHAHIRPFKVQNVRIGGRQSTFTVPESDGEAVFRSLNKSTRDGRPLISRG
ncbi:MAG: DEAD/DEAH box helicase [Desulfovibrionaceae bacterium]